MSTSTLSGMAFSESGSIARCRTALPSDAVSIRSTWPTWTPRILTLASGFITRPARSETTVTGTVVPQPPRNIPIAKTTMPDEHGDHREAGQRADN